MINPANPTDLTIITVTFNNFDALFKTYNSIINSSIYPKEWIIIDGGSSDKTVDHFSALEVPGIEYVFVSEKDAGIYDAMNKGIRLANSSFLLFLNAGDTLGKNSFPKVIDQPLQLNFITASFFGRKRTRMLPEWYGIPAPHQALIFPNLRDNNLLYDTSFKYAADYDFYLKCRRAGYFFKKIKLDPVVYERGGFSDGDYVQAMKEKNKVVKAYFNRFTFWLVKIIDFWKILIKKLFIGFSPYAHRKKGVE